METSADHTSAIPLERLPTEASTPLVVPVIEERAVVSRQVVETGRVRLAKTVHEREELLQLPLQHEEVQVERVPVNQFVPEGAAPPAVRHLDNITIIPVLREVVVTRLLVVEEIHVSKRTISTTHTEPVMLRHEEISVERDAGPNASEAPASPPTGQ